MNKKNKIVIPIIGVVSVTAMIILNVIFGQNKYSWLFVFGGGILIAIITVVSKSYEKKQDDEIETKTETPTETETKTEVETDTDTKTETTEEKTE